MRHVIIDVDYLRSVFQVIFKPVIYLTSKTISVEFRKQYGMIYSIKRFG